MIVDEVYISVRHSTRSCRKPLRVGERCRTRGRETPPLPPSLNHFYLFGSEGEDSHVSPSPHVIPLPLIDRRNEGEI